MPAVRQSAQDRSDIIADWGEIAVVGFDMLNS